MNRRLVTAVAVASAFTLGLSACGKSDPSPTASQSPTGPVPGNHALGKVFNASDKKGGTLTYATSNDWDSTDPGDTYYGLSWNLLRLYGRSLVMFKSEPGAAGNQLTPDLAETLGVPSDGGKTWTYKLREGVKFEDGTPITSKDVKYAVLRSIDKDVLVNGPTYFDDWLDLQGYKGPYKDKGKDTNAITTPDDRTIVFHLKAAFGGFDYFAMLPDTVPVPAAKDTGVKYRETVVASGPYKFANYQSGKGFELVRNTNWDPATDPNRKGLPDKFVIKIGVKAEDIDNQIIAGNIDVDINGTGVQAATLPRVLQDATLRDRADNPSVARLWYTSINPKVITDINCRKAIEYAADKVAYQTAYGGPFAGGDIATGMMTPQIPGFKKFDLYPNGADHKGDITKAKDALKACGKESGFATNISYREGRPKEKAAAEALQASLGKVGIVLTLKGFATRDYFSLYAGKPSYRDGNNLGLMINGWGADWNDGYGMLQQIVDSRVIRESGGSSNLSVMIPEVDQLIDKAMVEPDVTKREPLWGQIDERIMQEAVILPGLWAKALVLRSKNAANVFVNEAFGQYDYAAMSVA